MNTKTIALTLAASALLSFGAMGVYADDCTTDYGGTTTCKPTDLFINKQIQDPVSGEYVENVTTPKFSQGNTVVYKLIVTNSSNQVLTGVKVVDNAPDNLEITDAQAPYTNAHEFVKKFEISENKKQITFYLDEMNVGQVKEMYIWMKFVGPYPSEDQFCRDNWATATAVERPNGDRNFARACVTNKVLGTTTLPVAGAEDLLMMAPFALSALGGMALMRKRK